MEDGATQSSTCWLLRLLENAPILLLWVGTSRAALQGPYSMAILPTCINLRLSIYVELALCDMIFDGTISTWHLDA